MISATRSWPHSQFSSSSRSRCAPNPLSGQEVRQPARPVRRLAERAAAVAADRHRRSGMTSAMASSTAPIVHSPMARRTPCTFDTKQLECVVAHDLPGVFAAELGELRDVGGEGHRIGEPLAVRPVRTEQDLVHADGLGEQLHVVLVVRRDPDVVPQLLDRVLFEVVRRGVGGLLEPLDQAVDEVRPVLDAGDLQLRDAG